MHDLLIYLLAVVIIVPLAKRVGLGSVIGYLAAGALLGRHGFALVETGEGASSLAEFGVIMMLLLIGLELNPRLLFKMRGPIFGLGGATVAATIAAFFGWGFATGHAWQAALVIGMVISASSTAVALSTLQEQGYAKSVGGERAFAVLLFQDLAVIPMLALLAFLGSSEVAAASSPARAAALILGAVIAVIAAGRFVLRPLFKLISRTKLRETFTALALLIVVAAAALMHEVGLSPALGAFLAGVVLADSEFKHQIESDIEPFKGLLMGLFFVTIGAGIKFGLMASQPLSIALWVAAIIAIKAVVAYPIARLTRIAPPESLLFAMSLAQGGEFAFVLLGQSGGLLAPETAQALTASIALTMALAPLLIKLTIRHGMSRLDCVTPEKRLPDAVDESDKHNPVLVIGIGRFGQTLVRFLRANGYAATVLDIDSEQIDVMARFGIRSYFGDGSRIELLHAAGLERARALVIAVDEAETAIKIAEMVRSAYPRMPIFSRAYDRVQAYKLLHLGVAEVQVETSGSALLLGAEIAKSLGMRAERADAAARLFQINNQRSIRHLAKKYHTQDRESFIQSSKELSEQMEAMLKSDPEELLRGAASDWPRPATAAPSAGSP